MRGSLFLGTEFPAPVLAVTTTSIVTAIDGSRKSGRKIRRIDHP
jgi:hypothetical protein